MNQRELKYSIMHNPDMTQSEKDREIGRLCGPYREMSDEELLQLIRDFTEEHGREPTQADLVYNGVLKSRFGPWNRMLERAGTRPIGKRYQERITNRNIKRKKKGCEDNNQHE